MSADGFAHSWLAPSAVVWVAVCAVFDIRTRTVPLWLSLPALTVAAMLRLVGDSWPEAVLVAALVVTSDLPRRLRVLVAVCATAVAFAMEPSGIILSLLVVWLLWELSLIGGADAKIAMTVVLLAGSWEVLIPMALAGGLVGMVGIMAKRKTVPYVVAIALGTAAYVAGRLSGSEVMAMKRFLNSNTGLESTEVALLIAAVVLVAYGAYRILGQRIAEVVMDIAGRF